MKNEVHIGKLIKQQLAESGLSISDFAAAIHKTRTNVYDIFKRKNVDIDLLIAISEVLHFDFIAHLHEAQNSIRHTGTDTETDARRTTDKPLPEADKYLVVKIVPEDELEQERSVLFSYKLDM